MPPTRETHGHQARAAHRRALSRLVRKGAWRRVGRTLGSGRKRERTARYGKPETSKANDRPRTAAPSEEPGYDVRGESLELFGVVDERVQQDHLGAGLRYL
jgi:hypothetical protein